MIKGLEHFDEELSRIESLAKERQGNTRPINGTQPIHLVEAYLGSHYEIRYNEVNNIIEYTEINKEKWRDLNENNLYNELKRNGLKYTISDLMALLKDDKFAYNYNPIKDYFLNLKWDGKERINKLADYIKATDQEMFNVQFKKCLVRCVACSIDGVFNKHCFVLVHEGQSTGKTSFIRWLCPPALKHCYFEGYVNEEKDSLVQLARNFIINFDELATLNKAEINHLKSLFSKDSIKARLPYDRRDSNLIRRCNFFGSTNSTDFLTDNQNVRWLCFQISEINFDYNNTQTGKRDIDINQIWAEAFDLYKKGFKYQLTKEELEWNERNNEQFKALSVEQELILKFFAKARPNEPFAEHLTATEISMRISTEVGNKLKFEPRWMGKELSKLSYPRTPKKDRYGYWVKQIINSNPEISNTDTGINTNDNEKLPF